MNTKYTEGPSPLGNGYTRRTYHIADLPGNKHKANVLLKQQRAIRRAMERTMERTIKS